MWSFFKQKSLQQTSKARPTSPQSPLDAVAVLYCILVREPKVAALQLHLRYFVRIPVSKESLTSTITQTL